VESLKPMLYFFRIGVIAYNIGRKALDQSWYHQVHTLRWKLYGIEAKIVHHGRHEGKPLYTGLEVGNLYRNENFSFSNEIKKEILGLKAFSPKGKIKILVSKLL